MFNDYIITVLSAFSPLFSSKYYEFFTYRNKKKWFFRVKCGNDSYMELYLTPTLSVNREGAFPLVHEGIKGSKKS